MINFLGEGGRFHLTQNLRLIANAVLLSPSNAVVIKANMKRDNISNEKNLTWEEKMTRVGKVK